jgi:hypothetical protein
MNVEAKPAFASGNIEIEAAVAEVQVPGRAEGIVDSAEHLPIGMRAHAKAAEIAIRCQGEAVTELAVIPRADQWIGPAAGREGVTLTAGSRPGLSSTLDENPQARNPRPASMN